MDLLGLPRCRSCDQQLSGLLPRDESERGVRGIRTAAHAVLDVSRDLLPVLPEQARDVAQKMNVRSLPTVAVFWKGELRDVLIGAQTETMLEKKAKWIRDVADGKGFFKRMFSK